MRFSTKDNVKSIAPFSDNPQEIVCNNLIDYQTRNILNGLEYWKSLGKTILDFLDHPDNKFKGNIGYLERKSIISNNIQYIRKEANNIDQEIFILKKTIYYKNNDKFKSDLFNLNNKKLKEKYGYKC